MYINIYIVVVVETVDKLIIRFLFGIIRVLKKKFLILICYKLVYKLKNKNVMLVYVENYVEKVENLFRVR